MLCFMEAKKKEIQFCCRRSIDGVDLSTRIYYRSKELGDLYVFIYSYVH